jgi:hypothetical protein
MIVRSLLLLAAATCVAGAQVPTARLLRVVTDDRDAATLVKHEAMPPGWHITTGPAALLYDPAHSASGRFAVEAEVFLFPGQSQEGYGVFLGGKELDSRAPAYVAILATRDGRLTIEQHSGTTATVLVPPSRVAAVQPHTGGEGTAKNVMRVSVDADSVRVDVNGTRASTLPRGVLPLDGTFGFRVGRDLNLHASRLDITYRLAPVPVRR